MSYGALPEGFSRKPLARILTEVEQALITEFGPEVIQTAESPLGQLNGLFADYVSQLWEMFEDVYQSYDPDQAEGTRLDTLGKIRLLRRGTTESDASLRSAISNQGRNRIDLEDITRAVRGVPGVYYAHVFLNDGATVDENNLAPGQLCIAALGGADSDIAATIRQYIAPGISTFGNTYISTVENGFCRSLPILRPAIIPVTLAVEIRKTRDISNCPAPSNLVIRDYLVENLTLRNGDDIDHYRVRSVLEAAFPNVEVLSIAAQREDETVPTVGGYADIRFWEIGVLSTDTTTVSGV